MEVFDQGSDRRIAAVIIDDHEAGALWSRKAAQGKKQARKLLWSTKCTNADGDRIRRRKPDAVNHIVHRN
jgi:hypothetical protein